MIMSTSPIFENITNHSTVPQPLVPPFMMTTGIKIWFVVFIVICGMGAILNFLIFLAVLSQHSLQTGSGWLIAHKQLLDGVICGIIYPLITSPVRAFWMGDDGPRLDCNLLIFAQLTLMQTGYWVALFLGINRFVALTAPHSYAKISSYKVITAFIITSWMIALAAQLPGVFGYGFLNGLSPFFICSTLRMQTKSYAVFSTSITFGQFLPITALGVLYITIFLFAWRKHRRVANEAAPSLGREVYQRKFNTAKLLFISYVWNTVTSQLPLILLLLIPPYMRPGPLMTYWMRTITVCEYAVNPVFFLALSRDYRSGCIKSIHTLVDYPGKKFGECLLYLGSKLVTNVDTQANTQNCSSGSRSDATRTRETAH